MPHHYPKNTLEMTAWCNTCKTKTQHLVSAGRIGRCVNDHHKDPPKAEPQPTQMEFFEERK